MRITSIRAYPISFRVPQGSNVMLGIGRAVKRDAVAWAVVRPRAAAEVFQTGA